MGFKTLVSVFGIAAALFFAPGSARAHLPYFVGEGIAVEVAQPEISKAYYGWLSGKPVVYSISSASPFLLYVNLLSPQVEGGKIDYSADIYRDGELFAKVDSADFVWTVTYEPFANDYYAKGPEYEADVPPGNYTVEISNSGDSGNYVLAVGKTEDLSIGEFLRTVTVLPRVKEQFFGKNFWEAFNNFIGLALLILLAVAAILSYVAFKIIKRWRLKNRLDKEYGKYQSDRSQG